MRLSDLEQAGNEKMTFAEMKRAKSGRNPWPRRDEKREGFLHWEAVSNRKDMIPVVI